MRNRIDAANAFWVFLVATLTIFITWLAVSPSIEQSRADSATPKWTRSAPSQDRRPADICVSSAHSYKVGGVEPNKDGPLRLKRIYCMYAQGLISPDGDYAAFIRDDQDNTKSVYINRLGDSFVVRQGPYDSFASLGFDGQEFRDIQWAADSKTLWVSTRKHMRPQGGWAIEPYKFYSATQGRFEMSKSLPKDAGYLDSVHWIDERVALGIFNTMGSWYRPEHEDAPAYIALLDARTGSIRAKLMQADLLEQAAEFKRMRGLSADGLADKDAILAIAGSGYWQGAFQAVILMRKTWAIWRPGDSIEFVPHQLSPEDWPRGEQGAFTKDSSKYLRTHGLRAVRHCPIPEWTGGPGGPTCTVPDTPVEGALADLHDVKTGKVLWRLRARAVTDWRGPAPAISPDGRYALIGYPPEAGDWRTPSKVALVSMKDGEVLQTIGFDRPDRLGFTKGGSIAYIQGAAYSVFYTVKGGGKKPYLAQP